MRHGGHASGGSRGWLSETVILGRQDSNLDRQVQSLQSYR